MTANAAVWWLLASLAVSQCWAGMANQRITALNTENDLPHHEENGVQQSDFVIQMPHCIGVNGVCTLRQSCREEYIHETSNLCGEQADAVCCLTRSPFEKHVLQLKSCSNVGSVCAFEEDCPEQDRHSNPLLCGDQLGVTCCKTLLKDNRNLRQGRPHNVEEFSCETRGGICRQEEQCPEDDRLGSSDMCGDQPYITCCRASDMDSPILPFKTIPSKKSIDKNSFDLKYKRAAHTVQTESCQAEGGICRQEAQCGLDDRLGTSDLCGDQPHITCCQATTLERPFPTKRTLQRDFNVIPEKKSKSRDPQVKVKSSILQSDLCRAQSGMCTHVTNCILEDQMGEDTCGGLNNITCCHLSFLESAVASEAVLNKRNTEVFPSKETNKNAVDGNEKRAAIPDEENSCRAQGGMCRQTDQCAERDLLGSASCGDLPYITCCKRNNDTLSSENESRSISDADFSFTCLMRGGLCRKNEDCFPEDRYEGAELCGSKPGLSCCKRLPPRVGECSARGGECVPEFVCQNAPRDKFGQCSGNDVCCIWTRILNPFENNLLQQ